MFLILVGIFAFKFHPVALLPECGHEWWFASRRRLIDSNRRGWGQAQSKCGVVMMLTNGQVYVFNSVFINIHCDSLKWCGSAWWFWIMKKWYNPRSVYIHPCFVKTKWDNQSVSSRPQCGPTFVTHKRMFWVAIRRSEPGWRSVSYEQSFILTRWERKLLRAFDQRALQRLGI